MQGHLDRDGSGVEVLGDFLTCSRLASVMEGGKGLNTPLPEQNCGFGPEGEQVTY